ncbi:hypothetical protein [Pelagibius sp.]|uniref:hypothetical protein n=1 Tax=Pelagibius sp. TaxID=1931238 RepID=UPI003B511958
MAEHTLSTGPSHRTMPAEDRAGECAPPAGSHERASEAAAAPATLPPDAASRAAAVAANERRIAALAARYTGALDALAAWVLAVEERAGPGAYLRPQYIRRYRALLARDDACARALARARPLSLRGVVLKLRPAFFCTTLREAEADYHSLLLRAALRDLERLARLPAP